MKVLKLSSIAFTALLMFGIYACQKDLKNPDVTSAAKGLPTECKGDYTVNAQKFTSIPEGVTCTTFGNTSSTFEWTITFPKGTQDVSHFSLVLDECVAFTDILAVYVRDNTSGIVTCLDKDKFTYQIDKSLSCTQDAVVKYDFGGKSGQLSYGLILKGNYPLIEGNSSWNVKSGAKSGCCSGSVAGPGCPDVENYCNLSQGYWFAKPQTVWCEDVELGSYAYTQAEGKAIWDLSKKGGISSARKAFTQYAAIYLDKECWNSELSDDVVSAMNTIVSILGTTKLTTDNIQSSFGAANDALLNQAASTISDYINYLEDEFCEE